MSCGYLWFRPRASPGFDGWIMLVHEEFETEDQAIYCEKKRLSSIGGVKEAALRAAGVHAELIGLDVDCGIIYNPPDDGDERLWVLDYFKERMIDFVAMTTSSCGSCCTTRRRCMATRTASTRTTPLHRQVASRPPTTTAWAAASTRSRRRPLCPSRPRRPPCPPRRRPG